MNRKTIAFLLVILLVVGLVLACKEETPEPLGGVRYNELITKKLTVLEGGATINSILLLDDTLDMNGKKIDLDADADTSFTADTDDQIDVEIGGADELVITASTMALADMLLSQTLGVENLGGLPSIIMATVPYTPASGTVATVADGEIWYVVDVFYNTATNFDCTGNDCTVDIGDGTDADGLLNIADADAQTTFADYTGAAAGWGGLDGSAPSGAFIVGGPHIYAPSGSAETIDYAIGGTDPAAGSMTVYVVYYRMQ